MVSRLNPSVVLPLELRSELKSHNHLTTLWSSFGTICRLNLKSNPRSLILKFIDPPVDTRSEGHLRKIISYRVERYFYEHLSTRLPPHVKVAKNYPVEPAFGDTSLVLEDLSREYPLPVARRTDLDEEQAKVVLRWIAGFHATYWGKVDDIPDTPPPLQVQDPLVTPGVWTNGGYWYLDTRSEEYAIVRDDPYYAFLDDAAVRTVADYLADPTRPGRTLLHGDTKGANIMFSKDFKKCALYDFQYCGKGLGVVDLVYFLATSVDGEVMQDEECADELLETYYRELVEQVMRMGGSMGKYTAEIMMKDLDMAMVDWFRFQAGWGFWGNSWVSEAKVKEILKGLEGKNTSP
ncbi:kinase-like domain-containing protein [Tricharina praecox]|uniref:kinase-like domain-containing protein n=1 Tax=Tricharina praecox TaxID=43433 RepID=UPI00221ECFBF|nr:kinase-like domain-containing protein [Tricharina praecox]KAI5854338.1 kinase-like domain-containing protein [Tricharina praecox]